MAMKETIEALLQDMQRAYDTQNTQKYEEFGRILSGVGLHAYVEDGKVLARAITYPKHVQVCFNFGALAAYEETRKTTEDNEDRSDT